MFRVGEALIDKSPASSVDPFLFLDTSGFVNTVELFREYICDSEIDYSYKIDIFDFSIESNKFNNLLEENFILSEEILFELEKQSNLFKKYVDFLIHGYVGKIIKSKSLSNSTSSFFKSSSMRLASSILFDKNEAFLFHSGINTNSSSHKLGVLGGRCLDVPAYETCDPSRNQSITA